MAKPKPDPILCKDQLQAMQSMLRVWGVPYFVSMMFWILVKQETAVEGVTRSRLLPFRFNRIQTVLHSRLAKNNRVLKGRQAGITTFFLLVRGLLNAITEGGKTCLLISQNNRYASMHFDMARRAYRLIGALDPFDPTVNTLNASLKANLLHTLYSNRRELVFDQLDSRVIVESAQVEEAGQGVTIHHAIASEIARWPRNPDDTVSNIRGALVPGGTFDEESTANTAAGYFYEQCLRSMDDEAKADARLHFFPWYYSDEYSLELTEQHKKLLIEDLTEEEKHLILQMHRDLSSVAWVPDHYSMAA